MKKIIPLLSFLFLIPFAEATQVLVLEVSGPITSGTLELFKSAFKNAEEINAEAIVILLDTPGGSLAETLEIIKLIDRSNIPVISYVNPQGATAWSAGTFILVSSHIAAMSPNTIIGSAQPASVLAYSFTPINETKIINALVALISEKARIHGRNETAAVNFIIENLNLNAQQAKKAKVIEFISPNIEDLLIQINGLQLNSNLQKTLDTEKALIVIYKPTLRIQFLNFITNPTLASLFLIIGIYALVFGLSSPGYGSEIVGVVLIALGLLGLGFSINLIALFLLILGIVLVLIEIYTPGFGLFGIAGIVITIIGSILVIPTRFPAYYISKEFQIMLIASVIIPSILVGILLIFASYKVIEIRRKKAAIGEIIGKAALVTERITPKELGYVSYEGEIWQAKSDKIINEGVEVIITGKNGPTLIVEKK